MSDTKAVPTKEDVLRVSTSAIEATKALAAVLAEAKKFGFEWSFDTPGKWYDDKPCVVLNLKAPIVADSELIYRTN